MADTLDVLTFDEAKAAIGQTSDNSNGVLAGFVTATSRKLDEMCGPIVERAKTEQYNGGCSYVRLRSAPALTFSSVTEYNQTTAQVLAAETNSAKTTNDYLWDAPMAALRRRSNGRDTWFPAGRNNVVVVYTAGRFTDTASVDEPFKTSGRIMVEQLWRRMKGLGSATFGEGDIWPTGFAVPNAAIELLGFELRVNGT